MRSSNYAISEPPTLRALDTTEIRQQALKITEPTELCLENAAEDKIAQGWQVLAILMYLDAPQIGLRLGAAA
jgi:hypothetical protein